MTALLLPTPYPLSTPSTSGSYSFSVQRDQVIRQALLDCGALDAYETPTQLEISDCAFKLNMLVKSWMSNTDFAPGLKVWTRKRAELFLSPTQYLYNLGQTGDNWVDATAGQSYPNLYGQTQLSASATAGQTVLPVQSTSSFNLNDYIGILVGQAIYWTTISAYSASSGTVTIPSPGLPAAASTTGYVWNYTKKGVRPVAMLTVTLRDIYANDTPLRALTLERYESFPTKTAPTNIADPTAFLYESHWKTQNPNGRLYLDVAGAQDVTKHLHCVYLAPVEDLLNPGDAVDYPQQWYRPLVWGLAKEIAPMFDCPWDNTMEKNLNDSLAISKQADPANTDVYFEVNNDDPYGP